MKISFYKQWFAMLFVAYPLFAFSNDAITKSEWYGQWSMNHDGHTGTLTISDAKVDCATTTWCDMVISYVNSSGTTISGTIHSMDNNLQHMIFYLNFQGNRQKFDAYIFSWDKNNLAGTTYWSNKTYGFSASKKTMKPTIATHFDRNATNAAANNNTNASNNTNTSQEDKVISKKILADDIIELRYSSGKIRLASKGGWIDKFPDGTERRASFAQVPAFYPPTVISDQNVIRWLSSIQQTLIEMIKEELLNDTVSIDNLLNKERSSQLNTYQIINNRFYFLNYLNNF